MKDTLHRPASKVSRALRSIYSTAAVSAFFFTVVGCAGDSVERDIDQSTNPVLADLPAPSPNPDPAKPGLGSQKAWKGPSAHARERMQGWLDNRYAPEDVFETLHDSTGQAFDCVRFGGQPAFVVRDASGRRIGYKAPPIEKMINERTEIEAEIRRSLPTAVLREGEHEVLLDGVNCPAGSVPIKKVSMEQLTRFASLEDFQRGVPPFDAPMDTTHEYAKTDYWQDNQGGASVVNIWSPYTQFSSEFSLSQIWVVRGSGSSKETVEAGWQDYPDRTGSWSPKLFVYSTQDGYNNTGCYDQTCNDWVQVSSQYSPGMGWSNHSVRGGSQYVFALRWWRGNITGNWYLYYKDVYMGYYPGSLYDSAGLGNKGARVSFGGEIVDDNSSRHTSTDMGSGRFASQGWQQAAYQRTLEYYDMNSSRRDVPYGSLGTFVTDSSCYSVAKHSASGAWGTYFYFGGSGYNAACP